MAKLRPDSVHDALLETDPGLASKYTKLYRGFYVGTIAAGATLDIVLTIPSGVEVTGFVRTTEIKVETTTSQFLTCTGYTLSGTPKVGKSLDRRQGRKGDSLCSISAATDLTGVIEHSPGFELHVADPAPQRQPSTQTEAGLLPAFDSIEVPAFRYVNQGTEIAQIKMYLVWQETEIEQ